MGRLSVPLINGLTGLAIPAEQVTGLLRAIPDEWERWSEPEDGPLDADTVQVLGAALRQLADQIDVECIALTTDDSNRPAT